MHCTFMLAYVKVPWLSAKYLSRRDMCAFLWTYKEEHKLLPKASESGKVYKMLLYNYF